MLLDQDTTADPSPARLRAGRWGEVTPGGGLRAAMRNTQGKSLNLREQRCPMSDSTTSFFERAGIDVGAALETDPPPLDFILPGFLSGTVGILIGSGGAGKSWLALEIATAIASGGTADLLDLRAAAGGKVLYVCLEDPELVLLHRVRAIGQRLGKDQRDVVRENMQVKPLCGGAADLLMPSFRDSLMRAAEGQRLVIVDTLSRTHAGDENSNSDMARLLGSFERVCARSGASVMLVHHTRKGIVTETTERQHAARGATALVDNARWGAALDRMTESESESLTDTEYSDDPLLPLPVTAQRRGFYCKLSYPKQNYSQPQDEQWFKREEGGVLIPARLEPLARGPRAEFGAVKRAASAWKGRPEME